jgi:hypothetical protein
MGTKWPAEPKSPPSSLAGLNNFYTKKRVNWAKKFRPHGAALKFLQFKHGLRWANKNDAEQTFKIYTLIRILPGSLFCPQNYGNKYTLIIYYL